MRPDDSMHPNVLLRTASRCPQVQTLFTEQKEAIVFKMLVNPVKQSSGFCVRREMSPRPLTEVFLAD